jgi:hypothetical protein
MRGDTEKNQKNFSIEPNFFPPEINIRLYDKNSESDYLFFIDSRHRKISKVAFDLFFKPVVSGRFGRLHNR